MSNTTQALTTAAKEVSTAITAMAPQFKASLPTHISPERFMRVTMTAVQNNPDLLTADRRSLYNASLRAAQAGLLPDGREGAIVTFGGKAQFMPMVAGIMKQVRNSGEISTWAVHAVYENDSFEYELGDTERIVHKPALRGAGAIIGAYSIVLMKDGERSREFMNIDQIEAIRKRSRSGNAGPWKTDYDEMAKKTVVRRHSKRLPMSTDLDGMLQADDELFAAEPDVAPRSSPEAPPVTEAPRRASRVSKMTEAAPAETPPASRPEDDDNVIDMVTDDGAGTPDGEHDSPI